jgi:hypothetical protein
MTSSVELVKETNSNKNLRSNTSDSMIALNDFKILDTEIEDNDNEIIINQSTKVNNNADWSNDFNWTGNDDIDDDDDKVKTESNSEIDQSNSPKQPLLKPIYQNDLGYGYDIKSIKLKAKPDNEIDNFFNDMEPVIVKTETSIFDQLSSSLPEKKNKFAIIQNNEAAKTNWDSDFEIDI